MRPVLPLIVLLVTTAVAVAEDAPTKTFHDAAGVVSIDLPTSFAVEEPDGASTSAMATLRGSIPIGTAERDVVVHVQRQDRFARASLALEVPYQTLGGSEVRGTRNQGPGFARFAFRPDAGDWVDWRHAVEANGIVYVVTLRVQASSLDATREVAERVLDTVKIGAEELHAPLPEGWDTWASDHYTVETDLRSKSRANAVVRELVVTREILEKALGNDPYVLRPAVVRIHGTATAYRADTERLGLDPDKPTHFVPERRMVLVDLSREKDKDFDKTRFRGSLRRNGAALYVYDYFGGTVPMWLSTGLTLYAWIGSESGGKADHPKTAFVEHGEVAARLARRLDEWFPLWWSQVDDKSRAGYELWAWHWFLRHSKSAQPYRESYENYVRALRLTGSLAIASTAWEGIDQVAMRDAVHAFGEKWR